MPCFGFPFRKNLPGTKLSHQYQGVLVEKLLPLSPNVIEINQDADGIIPEEITKECEQRLATGRPMPKLLYVNPTGANPTGAVLSEIRRRKVYELAQKYNFLIVEDDPYCFVHFLDKQPTSFFSLDTDGRVIRMDSFSKIMSAGIRVGVVTAHRNIVKELIIHMDNSTIHASALSQVRLLILYILGLAEWYVPQGGLFLWIKLIGVDNVLDLVMNKCIPQGVVVVPGNAFSYDSSKPNHHLRFSFSYASPEDMDKGLSIVAKIIREEVAKKNNNVSM
ncbi:kynurenine/alpha-aminoadipate aminotransferase, mitochondrial-like [Formica exsecta]|uniref:kynurenine/alpha-aminoadipate aminotransferase, mitochondrial-like n=1 Tax=Formica exsecta TaxID=72781 RepID=UPI0011437ACD|nr:kynurenine/alpha-aminoadipate aminotransferase, mitochondrial-like [Formica exsecta]